MPSGKMTPGTWHVNAIKSGRIVGDETSPKYDKLEVCAANCTVATVYHRQDARPIAVLPELVEAARVILDQADETYPHFESERGDKNREALRRILAQIEGSGE